MKPKISVYKVRSVAKVNVGLRVLAKRKDGYHNIETIFYPVKIYDKIAVKISRLPESAGESIIDVRTSGTLKINSKENICHKAADLFMKDLNLSDKYKISIEIKKQIPIGAGLGGGSGNAAAVLKVLAGYFGKMYSNAAKQTQQKTLSKIALQLGSDVPYFMMDGAAAYGTGRGEKLTKLSGFRINGKILIVNPGIHVSTPWAYKALNVKRSRKKMLNDIKRFDNNDERLMINDFERVVLKKYPEIEAIKLEMLRHGAEFSLMSGSGSTVYGVFKPKDFSKAFRFFKDKGFRVFWG